jgi:hypothetical protein
MVKNRRIALLVACALALGCGNAVPGGTVAAPQDSPSPQNSPLPTALVHPSPTATPALSPTPSPTVTLRADPVLVRTLADNISEVYQIAVAPSPTPLEEPTAQTRATQIGALVGLDAPSGVFLSVNQTVDPSANPTWVAVWTSKPAQPCPAPTCIDGFPVDPTIAAIQLEMDAYGTVLSFSRLLGPTQPKPAHLITEAQARKAAGGRPDHAELVWTFQPPGSRTFRLAWQLQYGSVQPSAEGSRCMTLLDAGTGAQLFAGCTS